MSKAHRKPQPRQPRGQPRPYQRSDGIWAAAIELTRQEGKRRRLMFYGASEAEAGQRRDDYRRTELGQIVPGQVTVGQFLDDWLAALRPIREPKTIETHAWAIRHIQPTLGAVLLTELTPGHVQALVTKLVAKRLSARSVQIVRNTLRAALNRAADWEYVTRNVAARVPVPSVRRPKIEPLTLEEARRFLASIQGHRLEAFYTVVMAIGLRPGEAMGLRWRDVDLDRGLVTIRSQLQQIDGAMVLKQVKTEESAADLPLPALCRDALARHLEAQQIERRRARGWANNDLVFCTREGGPLARRNMLRQLHQLLGEAGIARSLRLHDLRHSCGTLLIAEGVNPVLIQRVLRHARLTVTADTYLHVSAEMLRGAVDQLGTALSREATG